MNFSVCAFVCLLLQQEADERKELAKKQSLMAHNADLRNQININIEKRERERQARLEVRSKHCLVLICHSLSLPVSLVACAHAPIDESIGICLQDGAQARHDLVQEKKRLHQIKAAKIAELKKAGVPAKYLAELESAKTDF